MKIDQQRIRKILYINLAFIGDIILSTPAIRALRAKYPAAIIDMLVTPWASQAARGNPYVDEVHIYDKKGEHRKLAKLWQLLSVLRTEKYDLVITANYALRGAMVAKMIGARYRVGYDAQHAAFFLTHTTPAKRMDVKHETENQLAVLQPLGISTTDFSLEFQHNAIDIQNMHDKMGELPPKTIVVICPFGRHPLNNWTTAGYVALLTQLSAVASCYLIGGQGDKENLLAINQQAGDCGTVLAGNLTIGELAVFLGKSSLVITVDTGPMHLAAAVGAPILALFGRSDERVWGPRGEYDQVLRLLDLPCAPCIAPRECSHHSCMKNLTSEVVIAKALGMLKK